MGLDAGGPEDLQHVAFGVVEVEAQRRAVRHYERDRDALGLAAGIDILKRDQALDLDRDVPGLRLGEESDQRQLVLGSPTEEHIFAERRDRARLALLQPEQVAVEERELSRIRNGQPDVADRHVFARHNVLLRAARILLMVLKSTV